MALTPKQEAFAQAVATGKSQSDAYRAAYAVRGGTTDKSIHEAAAKIASDAKVSSRIAELRQAGADAATMTLETHLRDLLILRNKALKLGQTSAAVQAEIARGKAAGVLVERKSVALTGADGGPVQVSMEARVDFSACTDEQLRILASLPLRAS